MVSIVFIASANEFYILEKLVQNTISLILDMYFLWQFKH